MKKLIAILIGTGLLTVSIGTYAADAACTPDPTKGVCCAQLNVTGWEWSSYQGSGYIYLYNNNSFVSSYGPLDFNSAPSNLNVQIPCPATSDQYSAYAAVSSTEELSSQPRDKYCSTTQTLTSTGTGMLNFSFDGSNFSGGNDSSQPACSGN